MKKTKKHQIFMVLLVVALIIINIPIALTDDKEYSEKDNKIIFEDFESCKLFEIESEEEGVVEIGAGFIDLGDYQSDDGEGQDVPGERIRIEGEGTIHFNDDNKFTHIEDLTGKYQILDEEGNMLTEVRSVDDKKMTVYNNYETFKDEHSNHFGDKGFNSSSFRNKEGNIIYAAFNQDLIIGKGYFEIERKGSEVHMPLDITSGTASFKTSSGDSIDINSDNSLFVYENLDNMQSVYGFGVIKIGDGTSNYQSSKEYLHYQKDRTATEDSINIKILEGYGNPEDDKSEEIAIYTKEARISDGEYTNLIHYIIPEDAASLKLVHNSKSFDQVAKAIKEGKEVELDRVTTITLPDSKHKEEKTYFLDSEGLNGYYIGSDENKVNFYSVDGIKFKTCAEAGEPCDYITCCAGPEYCTEPETGSESIFGKQTNKVCEVGPEPEPQEENIIGDNNAHQDGDIYTGGDAAAGEFHEHEEMMEEEPIEDVCPECYELIHGKCEYTCREDEECIEGRCVDTECREGEEFNYETLRCEIIECDPCYEIDRYGECVPKECPDGEECDVEKDMCVPIKEMPALELLLNGENKDLVIEKGENMEVEIVGKVIEGDSNARTSIKIDGKEIKSGYDEVRTTYEFKEEGRYSISFEYPESDNYLVDSARHNVIIQGVDEGPVWLSHGAYPISDTPYAPDKEYEFWIEWYDKSGIKKVELEHNFDGSKVKETIKEMSNEKYAYTTKGLDIGTYTYKWYATNEDGLEATTEDILYKVRKGKAIVTIKINDEVLEDKDIQLYKGLVSFNILLEYPGEADMVIVLDQTRMNTNSFKINMDQFGYYKLAVKVPETVDSEETEIIKYINITKFDPEVLIKINENSEDDYIETTQTDINFNFTLSEPEDGLLSIFIDDEFVETIDEEADFSTKFTRQLDMGEHEINATFHGTERYRKLSFVKTINVIEAEEE
jgi:hypothetical protein